MSKARVDKLVCRYPNLFKIAWSFVLAWVWCYLFAILSGDFKYSIWILDEGLDTGSVKWINLIYFSGIIIFSFFSLVLFASFKESLPIKVKEDILFTLLLIFFLSLIYWQLCDIGKEYLMFYDKYAWSDYPLDLIFLLAFVVLCFGITTGSLSEYTGRFKRIIKEVIVLLTLYGVTVTFLRAIVTFLFVHIILYEIWSIAGFDETDTS